MAKTALYKNLETRVSDIRLRETEARPAFADACNAITNIINPVAKNVVGVVVPDTKGGGECRELGDRPRIECCQFDAGPCSAENECACDDRTWQWEGRGQP